MKAMIFAAGLGTRLRPLTDTMPKALVPVSGQPLLSIVGRKLINSGANELVINAHHFSGQIVDYVEAVGSWGVHVDISLENDELLETGGGILHAEPFLKDCGSFLVHNVDILSNADLSSIPDPDLSGALATLLVSDRPSSRHLLFDEGMRLVGWRNDKTGEVRSPYPDFDPSHYRSLSFSGIHFISGSIFEAMRALGFSGRFSIIDFYLSAAARYTILGHIQDDLELLDVGKLDSLEEAASFLRKY